MKIFAITADVTIINKPDWLDDFRAKYDKPYDFHVTLKQPCDIIKKDMPLIIENLNTFFKGNNVPRNAINLSFNELVVEGQPGEICIMLADTTSHEIADLQKSLVDLLKDFSNYHKPKYQTYEENFQPHITIARNLTNQEYTEAKTYLGHDITCTAIVNKIILHVVDNLIPEESKNPHNQTVYSLSLKT